jgi:hypothetical protein
MSSAVLVVYCEQACIRVMESRSTESNGRNVHSSLKNQKTKLIYTQNVAKFKSFTKEIFQNYTSQSEKVFREAIKLKNNVIKDLKSIKNQLKVDLKETELILKQKDENTKQLEKEKDEIMKVTLAYVEEFKNLKAKVKSREFDIFEYEQHQTDLRKHIEAQDEIIKMKDVEIINIEKKFKQFNSFQTLNERNQELDVGQIVSVTNQSKTVHDSAKMGHICKECGKSMSSAGNLKVHMLKHTGERRFTCNRCDKAFTQYGNLKAHQLIHSGETPFQCKICGKPFRQAGNLKHTLRRGTIVEHNVFAIKRNTYNKGCLILKCLYGLKIC